MGLSCFLRASLCALASWGAVACASEIAVGTPREKLIEARGQPVGVIAVGDREILTYPEGKITLKDGKVFAVDLPASQAGAAAGASGEGVARASQVRMGWLTDFNAAQEEATKQNKGILALFTGSDWCPPCIRFEKEVARNPQFLDSAQKKFVLLKLDYPRTRPQPASVRQKNEALLRKYGVGGYPTILLMAADGSDPRPLEFLNFPKGDTFAEQTVAALAAETSSVVSGPGGKYLKWVGVAVFLLIAFVLYLKR